MFLLFIPQRKYRVVTALCQQRKHFKKNIPHRNIEYIGLTYKDSCFSMYTMFLCGVYSFHLLRNIAQHILHYIFQFLRANYIGMIAK